MRDHSRDLQAVFDSAKQLLRMRTLSKKGPFYFCFNAVEQG